jgi:hypothetical protein
VAKGSLRILAVENVGETFNQQVTRLRYTPRRLAVHPNYGTLFVAESDHAAIPLAEREDVKERVQQGAASSDAAQVCCLVGVGCARAFGLALVKTVLGHAMYKASTPLDTTGD